VIYGRTIRYGTPVALFVLVALALPRAQQPPASQPIALVQPLVPTAHAPIPRDPFRLWLAPVDVTRKTSALNSFTNGTRKFSEAKYTEALPLVSVRLAGSPLAQYGQYYRGLTEERLSHLDSAKQVFGALLADAPVGYLSEAVRLRLAEIAEAQGDLSTAVARYKEIAAGKPVAPEDLLLKLAQASKASGDAAGAAQAWARVYYEYPLSDQAAVAQSALDLASAWQPLENGSPRFKLEVGRAERLFGSKRYAQARTAFENLKPYASGDDAELVGMRLAECDHYLRRFKAARDEIEPYTRSASRRAEAQFFYLTSARELGARDEFVRLTHELVSAYPTESWSEEALNNLATHFIVTDDDDAADATFREVLDRFPNSRHAQRASWKVGWNAYRSGRYDETVKIFEQAASRFPRSDFRPSWLYWDAQAHDKLGHPDVANARLALIVSDYQNSYYGRMASKQLADRSASNTQVAATSGVAEAPQATPDPGLPPTHDLIRQLIAFELYDDAMNELLYAQRTWGDSPAIQATIGLVYSKTGELRRGINAMKRAYPQYLAAGGEQLPVDMLRVLFPVAYFDLIKKHAAERGLDPYLVSALMAQESTFDPSIKSSANAVGLMQVLPSTGRRLAKRVGVKRYRNALLIDPDTNIRLGTELFSNLVDRFGGVHLALASYNAGESAVARWMAEKPGITKEEFIDDIPFPETQGYVRKIIGTAEDYRRLYGTLGAEPGRPSVSHPETSASFSSSSESSTKHRTSTKHSTKKPKPKKKHH
jgi:soluble lytic murein transglycosylase